MQGRGDLWICRRMSNGSTGQLPIWLSAFLSIYPPFYVSIFLSIYFSLSLSLSLSRSTCLSVSLSFSLPLLLKGKEARDPGTPPPGREALPCACGRGSKCGRGNATILAVSLIGGRLYIGPVDKYAVWRTFHAPRNEIGSGWLTIGTTKRLTRKHRVSTSPGFIVKLPLK